MQYYLITYNRRTGEHAVEEFGDHRARAMDARFTLEREHRSDPDIEIVVLSSDSRHSIERTHPRYFQTLSQLAASATI